MTLKAYPFIPLLFFLMLGIIVAEYALVEPLLILVCSVGAALSLIAGLWFKLALARSVAIYSLLICIGFGIYRQHKAQTLPEKPILAYVARVQSPAENKPKSYKVLADIVSIKTDSGWVKGRSKVLLYFRKDKSEAPKYGDIFLINAKPRNIEGPKNPFEFDYQKFQLRKGILYHHFLRVADYQWLGHRPASRFMQSVYSLRQFSIRALSTFIIEKAELGVSEAMIIGIKDELDTEVLNAYSASGAIHLLAVSGLHVGILMLMLNFVFGFLKKLSKGPWFFGLATLSCLWVYAFYTGLSPSVTRAVLMFSLFQLGSLIQSDKNNLNILACSAFILLIFKPFWLFDVGFQLSYLAVFGILFLYPYLNRLVEPQNKVLRWLWQITAVSVSAQLFTFPLSIYYFHQFPLYFLLTNPLVSLTSTAVLVSGLLVIVFFKVPFLSFLLQKIMLFSLKALNLSVFEIAALPHAKLAGFYLSATETAIWYLLIFFFILFFLQKTFRFFYAVVVFALMLTGYNIRKDFLQKQQQQITVHFIPKGSGISLIHSKTACFITDSQTANNPQAYTFHLKNYYDQLGIQQYSVCLPDTAKALTFLFGNKQHLWIRSYFTGPITEDFERIMVSNNAVYSLRRQFKVFPKLLILDGTNSQYRIAKLKIEADSLGIPLIDLYKTGAVCF